MRGGKYITLLKEIASVSLPVVVEQVFITLMGLVNTAMIASLGTEALSAAGHVNNASYLIIALFAALTTGGTIVVAQAVGAKEHEKAAAAGAQAVTLSVVFSIVLTILLALLQGPIINGLFTGADPLMTQAGHIYYAYVNWSFLPLAVAQTLFGVMRGSGDTATPMKISLFMNIVNFLLCYILILGLHIGPLQTPGFGMHGAGWALSLARLAGMAAAVYVIVFRTKKIRMNKWSLFIPSFLVQKSILNLGIPTSVESTLFQAGRFITQMFIVGMGTAAMAANTVASSIVGFVNVPGTALSTGVMILIGQRIGRKDTGDIYKTTMFSVAVCAVVMGIICLGMLPFTGLIAQAFGLEDIEAGIFRHVLWSSFAASILFWAQSFVIPSALRATGDVHFTMAAAIASMWVFRIAIGYVLGVALGLGVLGVWCAMYTDWVVRGVLYYLRLRKKWPRPLM